jgi:uncharacterized protein YdhG (YjbR/CyaY superfamily)
MKIEAKTVDEYLDKIPPKRKEELEKTRVRIHQLFPDVEEVIEYNMPSFRRNGKPIAHLASQVQYISLYIDPKVMDNHRDQLDKLNCGKSCLRFTKVENLHDGLLDALLKDAGT